MCVYSMIEDHYLDKWRNPPYQWPKYPYIPPVEPEEDAAKQAAQRAMLEELSRQKPKLPTQEEIDEFRKLLERAREYDKRMNQPDCENDDKRKALKDIASHWGIDISFIDGKDEGEPKEADGTK